MKPLKPSAREKKRYLLVRLSQVQPDLSKSQIKGNDLKQNIEKAILDFIGILGLSRTGMSFIKADKDIAIICINRKSLNEVRASFCVFPEKIEVKKVSGTLAGLGKNF